MYLIERLRQDVAEKLPRLCEKSCSTAAAAAVDF